MSSKNPSKKTTNPTLQQELGANAAPAVEAPEVPKEKNSTKINRSTRRQQKHFTSQTKTQQQFASTANINSIMRKYQQTGVLPATTQQAQYLQNSALTFHEAQQLIIDSKALFSGMPSHIRANFNNDPQKLIEFLSDPANIKEAQKLGLMAPDEVEPNPVEAPPRVEPQAPREEEKPPIPEHPTSE